MVAFTKLMYSLPESSDWCAPSHHTTNSGYTKDCEKYNAAAVLGWRVLRYTTSQVHIGDAINEVLEVLRQTRSAHTHIKGEPVLLPQKATMGGELL
jgi:hypothetical protein